MGKNTTVTREHLRFPHPIPFPLCCFEVYVGSTISVRRRVQFAVCADSTKVAVSLCETIARPRDFASGKAWNVLKNTGETCGNRILRINRPRSGFSSRSEQATLQTAICTREETRPRSSVDQNQLRRRFFTQSAPLHCFDRIVNFSFVTLLLMICCPQTGNLSEPPFTAVGFAKLTDAVTCSW